MMYTEKKTIAILGGGVIGLMTAWRLSRAGHHVHVYEKERIASVLGHGASMAALGALMPLPPDKETAFARMQRASHALYPQWAAALEQESGCQTHYRTCGRVQALYRDRDVQQAQALGQAYPKARGYRTFQAMQQEKDFLYFGALGALTCHETAFISPQHLLLALKKALLKQGAVLHENTEAQLIEPQGAAAAPRIARHGGAQAEGHVLEIKPYDAVVIATGCGAFCAPDEKNPFSVLPVKGEALDVRVHPAFSDKLGMTLYRSAGIYVVQVQEGVVRLGAADTKDGRALPTAHGTQQLFALAQKLLNPAHYGLPSESKLQETDVLYHWAGMRPKLAHADLPLVEADARTPHIIYALGHYKTGIGFAPETARQVCALLGA